MHWADPGVELNARQPLHRIAAGTAALALYTVWLGPSAAAANPKPAPAAVNADSGSPALTIAEQEIVLTAYEKADRAHRLRLEPVAPVRPDAPVPPPAPAPPKPPTATATKKTTTSTSKSTSPTRSGRSTTASKSSSTAGITPPSGAAGTVVSFALAQVGKRYVYATAGPNTYDCSGLVMAAYAKVGIKLPHQSEQIAARGRQVPSGQWMPGDVIHMPGHVAIYIGNGKMVEAANPSAGVRVAPVRGGTAYRFL
ncbi:C40 family peptidase [Dactylosporangium salmoneum]|uniref:NlpC/P60 domain-containing protein n=1 Tax=Dactylosporangium salmoneum TaxID=53361 RepID=A0ABP5UM42_9ACTN